MPRDILITNSNAHLSSKGIFILTKNISDYEHQTGSLYSEMCREQTHSNSNELTQEKLINTTESNTCGTMVISVISKSLGDIRYLSG